MNSLYVWMQPVGGQVVSWLVSRWGATLLLLGTLALAGSTGIYLASSQSQPSSAGAHAIVVVVSGSAHCVTSLLVVQDGGLRDYAGPKCH
jgi:hypothetical protein